MSPVKSPLAVARLVCPQVPLVYPSAGDNVAAIDALDIPTGHHQAPSPEPPHGQIPQTFAACIHVHVASLYFLPEALNQYLLSPSH
jgi:hypothetical protein